MIGTQIGSRADLALTASSVHLPPKLTTVNPSTEKMKLFSATRKYSVPEGFPIWPLIASAILFTALPFFSLAQSPELRRQWERPPTVDELTTLVKAGQPFVEAERNSRWASEGLCRSQHYMEGWLALVDPQTGLIPENEAEGRDRWNGFNNAADNYAFLVLTSALTDRDRFNGQMLDMLRTETTLTSRLDRLGDTYKFSKQDFEYDEIDMDRLVFCNAEYVKDGLIPLTEWIGPSPWSERMTGLIDDIWKNASVDTQFGKLPTLNIEVNGDLLQASSRLYWFTGDRKYLDWAIRLGDYYLLGTNHPTRDLRELVLEDHGGEIVNGLSELYFAVSQSDPAKKAAYQQPLYEMFDDILAQGRNADGMFYTTYNPQTGANSGKLCDTWGYIYDGFLTLAIVDNHQNYFAAASHALKNLCGKYEGRPWADQTMDGIADSVESALNLINRIPSPSAEEWCDRQMRLMWGVQRADGVIEGWHGDGNFARTTIMHALWKTQGIFVSPWRADVRLGATHIGDGVCVFLTTDQTWKGRVVFDHPRHADHFHFPYDYPRINQFPEWFAFDPKTQYTIEEVISGEKLELTGAELSAGVPVTLAKGQVVLWRVAPHCAIEVE